MGWPEDPSFKFASNRLTNCEKTLQVFRFFFANNLTDKKLEAEIELKHGITILKAKLSGKEGKAFLNEIKHTGMWEGEGSILVPLKQSFINVLNSLS